MVWLQILIGLVVLYFLLGLKIIPEYQRSVLFTLGKFSRIMQPGLRVVLPVIQAHQRVDLRVKTVDVPDQEAITKDNISVMVNAVIYYKVSDTKKAILEVEDFYYATENLAQTTMRNIVGEVELDELLSNRESIANKIKEIVDKSTDPWGISVVSVDLKDVKLPEDMKRIIAKQAEAERERRAVVIKSEGELTAAKNLADAAGQLSASPGALHLRTLHSLNNLGSDKSNTVVLTLPLELLQGFEVKPKQK